ncbi:hypothetical protein FS749_013204 [Ceratobasidium sp. UAMH 11750]|nr:hypothetical protein FS749_013204 [Ceratobasidium sp. UAMH 11750]
MSFRFHRSIPNLSIFHNASSQHSTRILQLLRSSLSNPYLPPSLAARTNLNPPNPQKPAPKPQRPLEFNLDVSTTPPTPDQYETMFQYLRSQPPTPSVMGSPTLSRFLVKHSEPVNSTDELAELAKKNPSAVRWPVVVHWDDGLVAIEREDDVNNILEVIYEEANGGKSSQQQDWLS